MSETERTDSDATDEAETCEEGPPVEGPAVEEPDEVEASPPMLTRDDLLDPHKTREVETKVVAGLLIRGLSAVELHTAEAARWKAMREAKTDAERLPAGNAAEQAVTLALGVIEPRMKVAEWEHALKQPGMGGRMNQASNAIQELTGIVSWEVELAGKLIGQTQSDTAG